MVYGSNFVRPLALKVGRCPHDTSSGSEDPPAQAPGNPTHASSPEIPEAPIQGRCLNRNLESLRDSRHVP